MAEAIRNGIDDGSIRSNLDPRQTAVTLWGSMHGLIQLATNKAKGLEERYDLDPGSLVDNGLDFIGLALSGSDENRRARKAQGR